MSQGFDTLEFDLETALREQLVRLFDKMDSAPLIPENASDVEEAQGVYQLFHGNERVYVGKTDAKAGLRRRLERHSMKIQGREGLDPTQVTFKAVRIYVFTPMDLETQLIRHYTRKNNGKRPDWNNSGFGSNDPGRERETTRYKPGHFDAKFPIRTDLMVKDLPAGKSIPISEVLESVLNQVPYYMRFERQDNHEWHSDLTDGYVTLSQSDNTVEGVLREVAEALGPEWQITVLPGYVIGYRERQAYNHAQMIIRAT